MSSSNTMSDKLFYTILIPVASMVFCSVPPMLVHHSVRDQLDELEISPSTLVADLASTWRVTKWMKKYTDVIYGNPDKYVPNDVLEEEIPLIFRHESLFEGSGATEETGKESLVHKLELKEFKYLEMAEHLEEAKNDDLVPYIGYIHIFDVKPSSKDLPKGHLLEFTSAEWHDDGCTMHVKRRREFRILSIRRDKEEDLIYARIEWV